MVSSLSFYHASFIEKQAPELILGKYDQRCDIWSSGVTLFNLLSGCLPFEGEALLKPSMLERILFSLVFDVFGQIAPVSWNDDTVRLLFGKIRHSEPLFKRFRGNSSALNLVEQMLTKDPSKRITIEAAFNHPFITMIDHQKEAPKAELEAAWIVD